MHTSNRSVTSQVLVVAGAVVALWLGSTADAFAQG
jgi:hypothetical protein